MPKLLVVEDELLMVFMLQKGLTSKGYDIADLANDGEQAVEAARQQQPDAILMDIRLRGPLDGIETAERIREFSLVPILFMTAMLLPDDIKRIQAIPRTRYLIKPVTSEQLCLEVEAMLNP